MKNNKLVIENGDSCEKYDILLNIEVNNNNYVIYIYCAYALFTLS